MKKKGKAFAVMAAVILSLLQVPAIESRAAGSTQLSGRAHVQTYGDQNGKITYENGIETLVLGTRGQAKRVENVTINLVNNTEYQGMIQYQVHRQTYGWTDWVNAGTPAGTSGQGKRLEAIRIRLVGTIAEYYDVRYSTHIQSYGDAQGWVYNGALAGTTGEAKRLEEIKVQIIPKNTVSEVASISYRVHRQTYGWENSWRYDGQVSGTTGQAKRLEGISIDLKGNVSGNIAYRTHVQSYGWTNWVQDGEMSGTQGQAKRLEAIQIKIGGRIGKLHDIYYRVHAQHFGWMAWVKNGEPAGTSGYGYRLEAIQIVLVKKGAAAPSTTYGGVVSTNAVGYSDKNTSGSTPGTEGSGSAGNTSGGGAGTVTTNEPVWHDEKTEMVTMLQCTGCGRKYKDETEFNRHLNEDYDDQCEEGTTTYTPKTYTFTLQEGYYEYAEAGKTYVPAEYETQWVVTDASYTEPDVEWYRKRVYVICSNPNCREKFYGDVEGELERLGDHLEYTDCWGYIGDFSEWYPDGTKDIVHPERGYYTTALVKNGYWK